MDKLIEAVLNSHVTGWGAALLLMGFLVWGLVSGKLYTSRQVDIVTEAANTRAADYKSLYEGEAKAHTATLVLLDEVVRPIGETTAKIMSSLNRLSEDETEVPR